MSSRSSSAIVPLLAFNIFPELPTELRLNIFRRALPQDERVIEVHCRADGSFYAESSIPALLHTSFEARVVAMETYTQVVIENSSRPERPFGAFIKYSADMLYIQQSHSLCYATSLSTLNFLESMAPNLQRLIINPRFFKISSSFDTWNASAAWLIRWNFTSLKEIIIIIEREDRCCFYTSRKYGALHSQAVSVKSRVNSVPADEIWPALYHDSREARWIRKIMNYEFGKMAEEEMDYFRWETEHYDGPNLDEPVGYIPEEFEGVPLVSPGQVVRRGNREKTKKQAWQRWYN